MKSFKRLSALIVASVLALTLVSCGGDEESKSSSTEASADESAVVSTIESEEVSEAASEEASEAVSEEVSESASEEVSEVVSEEVSEPVSEDVSEEASEAPAVERPTANAAYGSPKIDAKDIDAIWDSAVEYKGEIIREAYTNSDTHTRFTFKVMWDETSFYVLEKVTDISIGGFKEELTWQNDSTEICLSLTSSDATAYDFSNDGWVGLSPHKSTYVSDAATLFGGAELTYVDFDAYFNNSGYVICAKFDIAGMSPDLDWKEGHKLGLEISVNDSVTEGERECTIAWADPTDYAYQNPSLFGIVELVK